MGSKVRSFTIDFTRGVAILLVVLGHNIQFGSGNVFYQTEGYFENFMFKLIYSFHMPLFALLSGYLFFWSMRKPVKQVLKKRMTSLMLPIFCWVTVECLGRAATQIFRHKFVFPDFACFYMGKILNSFWFLWAIFWCSMIVMLVEKAFKGRMWIYGLIMIPILFTPAKYNFQMYAYMCPYFVAGFLFNKYDGRRKYRRIVKKDCLALVIALVVFIILFLFYGRDSYIYTTGISLLGESGALVQIEIDIYRWVIGFAGSVAMILLCKMMCDKWQGKSVQLFAYFGQISLGIYILNSYVNSYVLRRLTSGLVPNVFIWIAETVVSVAVYIVAVEAIKKIPVAKKLLLGGR